MHQLFPYRSHIIEDERHYDAGKDKMSKTEIELLQNQIRILTDRCASLETPVATSWIVKFSVCKICRDNLIICQAKKECADYWWYCANKSCQNHHPGEQLGDQDECSFSEEIERPSNASFYGFHITSTD